MDTMKHAHQSFQKAEPPATLWQKLVPLALIFFCASFNLTILANLKDAIVSLAATAPTTERTQSISSTAAVLRSPSSLG